MLLFVREVEEGAEKEEKGVSAESRTERCNGNERGSASATRPEGNQQAACSPQLRLTCEWSKKAARMELLHLWGGRDGASKGDSPFRLMDKFGLLWESKSPFPQAA